MDQLTRQLDMPSSILSYDVQPSKSPQGRVRALQALLQRTAESASKVRSRRSRSRSREELGTVEESVWMVKWKLADSLQTALAALVRELEQQKKIRVRREKEED